METSGAREEQHLWCLFVKTGFPFSIFFLSLSVLQSKLIVCERQILSGIEPDEKSFFHIGKHDT